MHKRLACLALFLCVLLSGVAYAQGDNLVKNPSFEEGDGMDSWALTAWEEGDVYTSYEIRDEGVDGDYCAYIRNYEKNDARFEQTIEVEGNTTYRFSARIKANHIGQGGASGANLSVMNTFIVSDMIESTGGEWVQVEFYGKTERKQTSISIAARLGYYGGTCMGEAWFDDIRVEKVDGAPSGAEVFPLKTNKPGGTSEEGAEPDRSGINAMVMAVLFAFVALLLIQRASVSKIQLERRGALGLLAAILAAGALIRLYVAYTQPGYEVDVNCFASWGNRLLSTGPSGFYQDGFFCDYPPGYIIAAAGMQAITNALSLPYFEGAHLILLKLPSLLCDLVTCFLLYRIGRKLTGSDGWGLLLAALYAASPAIIADSAAWGQVDSVMTVFVVLMLYSMVEKRMFRASIFFCIGLLLKPQMLMMGPILLLAFIGAIVEDWRKGLKTLGISFGVCLVIFFGVLLPFSGGRSPTWIWHLYMDTVGSYQYASLNAMNLFTLLGGNWKPQAEVAFLFSWEVWGYIFMILSIGYAAFLYLRRRDPKALVVAAMVIIAGVFAFGVRMHERYLYPVLAMLLLAAAVYKDRRFLYVFLSYSAVLTVNILLVLSHTHLTEVDMFPQVVFSLLNVLTTGYLFYLGWAVTSPAAVQTSLEREPKLRRMVISTELPTLKAPGTHSLRLSRLDAILLAALTLGYGVLAFINLGDTEAPETSFRASAANESVVFDLKEPKDIHRFYYYGEIPGGEMELSFSDDGSRFTDSRIIAYNYNDETANIMFKWHILDTVEDGVPVTARYVRVKFMTAGLTMFEVGLTGDDGAPYPLTIRERDGGRVDILQDPQLLVDEQHLIPERPTYMNSMYFDEIYHARTGYEHVHGMTWYESTHPPLGKVFMSWCIELLGMNPFAWRLAGTLAGILMLPGIYLIGKLLFKRTELAFAVTALMALDCMHFTQTRIATIDSFPVLFIIWSYFFMFLYANMSFYHKPFWKTLPPLALSGLFMGLGCASKWIGIYSAAGLAVIFFWTLIRRYMEYREARKSGEEELVERTRRFWKHAAITCLCCIGFFIIIPAAIYYGSYYQYLAVPNSGNDWRGVINYQTHMFNYHKQVFASHPYSSTWYQWPVIWKPMAFFFDYRMPEGWSSSITTFGNPAVWWAGLVAMVWLLYRWVRGDTKRDPRILLVIIGFLAQYLPWVLVPRTTFIYHYFASVPFIIFAIGFFLEKQLARGKKGMTVIVAYLIITALLFALFYPVASGLEVPVTLAKLTDWFPSWHMYWGG